jgi:glutaredoxin 3
MINAINPNSGTSAINPNSGASAMNATAGTSAIKPTGGARVMMYSTAVCPYCQRAEILLKSKGVTAIEKMRVDLEPALRAEMTQKTGRRTVPQIYIGDFYVGGFDDLAALDRAGGLEPLLRGETATTINTESK